MTSIVFVPMFPTASATVPATFEIFDIVSLLSDTNFTILSNNPSPSYKRRGKNIADPS